MINAGKKQLQESIKCTRNMRKTTKIESYILYTFFPAAL
jgi:hypothetical protein